MLACLHSFTSFPFCTLQPFRNLFVVFILGGGIFLAVVMNVVFDVIIYCRLCVLLLPDQGLLPRQQGIEPHPGGQNQESRLFYLSNVLDFTPYKCTGLYNIKCTRLHYYTMYWTPLCQI